MYHHTMPCHTKRKKKDFSVCHQLHPWCFTCKGHSDQAKHLSTSSLNAHIAQVVPAYIWIFHQPSFYWVCHVYKMYAGHIFSSCANSQSLQLIKLDKKAKYQKWKSPRSLGRKKWLTHVLSRDKTGAPVHCFADLDFDKIRQEMYSRIRNGCQGYFDL